MTDSIQNQDKLPVVVTTEQLRNRYLGPGIASRAFLLARYDMSPENPIEEALRLGFIRVEDVDEQ